MSLNLYDDTNKILVPLAGVPRDVLLQLQQSIQDVIDDMPTKVSDLQNDSGFITSGDIPSIPSKTSDLTNDSGFITSSALPTKTSDLTNDSDFITSSALHNETVLTCDTARNVAAKVVTFTGFELTEGAHIFVRFTSTATADPSSGNITLNINSTGAVEILDAHVDSSTVLTYSNGDIFCNGKVCEFVYSGTKWILINVDTGSSAGGGLKDYVFLSTSDRALSYIMISDADMKTYASLYDELFIVSSDRNPIELINTSELLTGYHCIYTIPLRFFTLIKYTPSPSSSYGLYFLPIMINKINADNTLPTNTFIFMYCSGAWYLQFNGYGAYAYKHMFGVKN